MDDEDYKPRSPDLSALNAYTNNSYQSSHTQPYQPQHVPQQHQQQQSYPHYDPSYYQPPPLPQHMSQQYNHSSYMPPLPPQYLNNPVAYKMEDRHDQWQQNPLTNIMPQVQQQSLSGPSKMRKMSTKQQQQAVQATPRPPAPGEEQNICIKTKFPVARIKRLVQADDEVGKVAQVTPPVVGKALELFMIQMTLAAIAEAQSRGSKRITAAHIKAAISADDQFDFLKDIGDKIPEGAGKSEVRERKPKAEKVVGEEDDGDVDGDYGRQLGKRKAGGRRRKAAEDE